VRPVMLALRNFGALLLLLPLVAHGTESPLLENELLEMRYADGVSKPVNAQWVRVAQKAECGQLTHRVRTDTGEELCGAYLPERMEFRPAAHANGAEQQIGMTGFDGYALPSDKTALLGYQVLSTPDGMSLAYSLVASHAPGVQLVASKDGSVAQGHMVLYELATETHGPNTSLSIKQLRVGQMVLDSGPLPAVLGQGFEWRKSNGLNQNNVQVFNGRLVSETDLTVLVNNEARTTVAARPGEVSVFNVPLFEGNNQVTVIYRNEKGELVQTSRNVFFSQNLLPKGKWLGSAGVYRDNRLQHWAAQAQIEQGVTEQLTLQGGVRMNMNPDRAVTVRNGDGVPIKPEKLEGAVSMRSFVAGGFLSAGFQGRTAYGPGIQRMGYARGTTLLFAERANGPVKLGFSFEPFQALHGLRLGYAKAMQGSEYEFTVSKSFRADQIRGMFMSVYCKFGEDSVGADSNFCGVNANLSLGLSPFSSRYGRQPVMAGLSYSKTDLNAQGATLNQQSVNGFIQTRDSYALVSKGLSFVRSRHDLDHFSLEGQYDSSGNLLAGVSGLVGLDYGNKPRVMGFLPNDPSRPGDALVAMDEILPATERGFTAVQTRINGLLSTGGLNAGAIVGQSNQILVNPESVSMDSDLPSLRLKISPAIAGIYKVGSKP
jgi:hypothetical protein